MQPTHHVLVSVGHWSSGLGVNGINDINNCHHWTLWDPLELLESSRVLLKISMIDFFCWHHHNSVKNSVLRPGSACVWSAASHDCSNSPVITPENISSSFPKIKIIKLMFNWCLDRNGSMMLGKYMQNICKDLGCIPVSWKPRCCYGPGMDSPFGMEHITQPRRARNWLCNPTLGYSKRETHGIRQNWESSEDSDTKNFKMWCKISRVKQTPWCQGQPLMEPHAIKCRTWWESGISERLVQISFLSKHASHWHRIEMIFKTRVAGCLIRTLKYWVAETKSTCPSGTAPGSWKYRNIAMQWKVTKWIAVTATIEAHSVGITIMEMFCWGTTSSCVDPFPAEEQRKKMWWRYGDPTEAVVKSMIVQHGLAISDNWNGELENWPYIDHILTYFD